MRKGALRAGGKSVETAVVLIPTPTNLTEARKGARAGRGIHNIHSGETEQVHTFASIIRKGSNKIGTNLSLDVRFLDGVVIGIMTLMYLGMAVLAILPMLAGFGRREIGVCRLLTRLRDRKNES